MPGSDMAGVGRRVHVSRSGAELEDRKAAGMCSGCLCLLSGHRACPKVPIPLSEEIGEPPCPRASVGSLFALLRRTLRRARFRAV